MTLSNLRLTNQFFTCSVSVSPPYKEKNFKMARLFLAIVSAFFQPFSVNIYSVVWGKGLPDARIKNKANEGL